MNRLFPPKSIFDCDANDEFHFNQTNLWSNLKTSWAALEINDGSYCVTCFKGGLDFKISTNQSIGQPISIWWWNLAVYVLYVVLLIFFSLKRKIQKYNTVNVPWIMFILLIYVFVLLQCPNWDTVCGFNWKHKKKNFESK